MVRQCCKLLCRNCNDTYLLLKSIIDWCFSVTTRALVLEISWNEYWCAFIYQNLGSFLYRSLYFNLYVKINLDVKETSVFYSLVLYHNSPLWGQLLQPWRETRSKCSCLDTVYTLLLDVITLLCHAAKYLEQIFIYKM